MKNWRPITLLCVDYKIAAKAIANRLLLVLQFLLHTDQSTLGLSLFWYLASFICIPDQVIRNINSRLFSFVWKRKQEWLARSSVTQQSSRGGLGIVDVPRKVASLHVLWVRRLVYSPDLPWFYFFRYFLRRAFAGRPLQQILLILSPSCTSMALLPPFYRSVMHSWFRLSRTFDAGEIVLRGHGSSSCPLKSLSARFAYQAFSQMDRTEHRCVEKFRSWGLTVHWKTVWPNLHLWRFLRPARDTAWLVAHGILPTADRLIRFGMPINPLCLCGQTESLILLFVDFPVATRIFAWYFCLVRRFAPTTSPLTPSEILCGYGPTVMLPPVFPCLLGVIRHQVWVARNGYRFEHIYVNYGSVLSSVKFALRFMLRVQRRHCPVDRYSTLWLANGILASVTNDDVIVFPDEFW